MGGFSFAVIPDTQKMTRYYPEMLTKCTAWMKGNAKKYQLKFALHVGDIVDQGALAEEEFKIAEAFIRTIEESNVPVLIAPGNHDYDQPIVSTSGPIPAEHKRNLHMFNQYFGTYKVEQQEWFGGSYESYKVENMYGLFQAQGKSILVAVLEFMPRPEVLRWLDEVVASHVNHELVIVTHSYMNIDGNRVHENKKTNPKYKYEAVSDGLDGEEMWQLHFKNYAKLRAVFSGHHLPTNTSYRMDKGVHGNKVLQCFNNWQDEPFGGEGRICLVHWDMDDQTMHLRVLNPNQGVFEDKEGYAITMKYEC